MEIEELAYLGINKLKMRFENKINCNEYYLSYSGGNDSELLRWFIKEYLKVNIPVVAVNTYREHCEIRRRMYRHSDQVLYPMYKMEEIKDKYGIPCFTKMQDEIIRRYQNGSRSQYTMARINRTNTTKFGLNNTAKRLLLTGRLHKVSGECCRFTKKEPLKLYEKETGLKPIIATRGSESTGRKNAYRSCLTSKGKFTPMYDFANDIMDAMYKVYHLEKPKIYDILDRTGCIGCPYGYHGKKNTLIELQLVTPAQREYAISSFKESYQVLGIEYNMLDLNMYKSLV
ncbi:hypothetical protein [Vallitalea guaymasensis]|uniref:hypothetical protein n=1 Tax=Vallitalea guaymasensis TaxID=1185412 RepID=UPI002357DEA5|nr:hypothetical protein [Vallitalea guaymasensis]